MKQAGIYKDKNGWLRLVFAYDREFSDDMKFALGKGAYRWNRYHQTWYILESFSRVVTDLFIIHGYEVNTETVREDSTKALHNPWDTIFQSVPDQTASKLFRAVAKVLHPDVATGSEAAMKQVNEAWQRRD